MEVIEALTDHYINFSAYPMHAVAVAKFLKIQEHVHFKVRAQTKILKSDSIQLIIGIHHSNSCMHGLFRHSI